MGLSSSVWIWIPKCQVRLNPTSAFPSPHSFFGSQPLTLEGPSGEVGEMNSDTACTCLPNSQSLAQAVVRFIRFHITGCRGTHWRAGLRDRRSVVRSVISGVVRAVSGKIRGCDGAQPSSFSVTLKFGILGVNWSKLLHCKVTFPGNDHERKRATIHRGWWLLIYPYPKSAERLNRAFFKKFTGSPHPDG